MEAALAGVARGQLGETRQGRGIAIHDVEAAVRRAREDRGRMTAAAERTIQIGTAVLRSEE